LFVHVPWLNLLKNYKKLQPQAASTRQPQPQAPAPAKAFSLSLKLELGLEPPGTGNEYDGIAFIDDIFDKKSFIHIAVVPLD
jgi:hypothetical protein